MAAKRKGVPVDLRFQIWGLPCVICGDSGDIEIDHIVPVAAGGSNGPDNLQPLCHQCHCRKGSRRGRSNEELLALYLADKEMHHLRNQYRMAVRYLNPFDAPSFAQWRAANA